MPHAPTLSLYRGYSRAGIGEGEGRGVAHGEQYLAADGELRHDQAVLDAARPWMTLDARTRDHEALGKHLEGWSYFRAGRFRFVARLTPAPERYDTRYAYFTHARAWPEDAFAGGKDLGVLIGESSEFESPWRTRDSQSAFDPPEKRLSMPTMPKEADRAVAVSLLGHLYQAAALGYPVVMAVPLSDFVKESALHPLVAFARLALPRSLKRDIGIRIYTRHPEVYLSDVGATLVVLPEDEATNALAARRDVTLLDRTGQKTAGRDLASSFACYADETVRRAVEKPDGLLRFSERVDRRPWSRVGTTEAGEVGFTYVVAAATGSTAALDQFVRSLYKTLEINPDALPRHQLLTVDDLVLCSDDVLRELLLKPRSTRNAMELRRMIEDAVISKNISLEPILGAWWTSGPDEELPLRTERIVEMSLRIGDAARVLQRATADQLARSIKVPKLIAAFMQLTDAGKMDAAFDQTWVPNALDIADHPHLVDLTLWMLKQPARLQRLMPQIKEAIERLFEGQVQIPQELASRLAVLWKSPPPQALETYLLVTELLFRAGHSEADHHVARLAALTGRENRRRVVELLAIPRWSKLATFSPPVAWEADTADLLVAAKAHRASQTIEPRVRLVAHRTLSDAQRRVVFAEIDAHMCTDGIGAAATTSALIRHRVWLPWRMATTIPGEQLRSCALHWLTSPVWRDGLEPLFEDWKEVVAILARSLAAEDFMRLGRELPRIRTSARASVVAVERALRQEQELDWLATAADLVGLAESAVEDASLKAAALTAMESLVTGTARPAPLTEAFLAWTVARFRDQKTPPPDLLETLEGILERCPVQVEPSEAAQRMASWAASRRFPAIVRALSPSFERNGTLVDRIVAALAEGDSASSCWTQVARQTAVLRDVAHRIASSADDRLHRVLEHQGWTVLERVNERPDHALLAPSDSFLGPLPVLQLGAVLNTRMPVSILAARLAAGPGGRTQRGVREWWQSVFRGLTLPRRHGFRNPADRQEAAIAMLRMFRPVDAENAFEQAHTSVLRTTGNQEKAMRIADAVTPFSPVANQSDRQVTMEGPDGEIMVLGNRQLDVETLKSRPEADWHVGAIANFLKERGGGLVVSLGHEGSLLIERVKSNGTKPARNCALITVGNVGMCEIARLSGTVLGLGSHVLLPTDEDGELRLTQFLTILDYLPSDRKLLVLNQIRRPSLEWRVNELERIVGGMTSTAGPRKARGSVLPARGFLERVYEWVWNPVGWIVMGVLLAVAGTLAVWRTFEPQAAIVQPQAETSNAKPTTVAAQQVSSPTTLEAAQQGLLAAMSSTETPHIRTLNNTHVVKTNTSAIGVAWAFLKLQLLKNDALTPDAQTLASTEVKTPVRKAIEEKYQVEAPGDSILRRYVSSFDSKASAMVALLACRAWDEPGLRGVASDPSVMIFSRKTCTEVKQDPEVKKDAQDAIEALTNWVKNQ